MLLQLHSTVKVASLQSAALAEIIELPSSTGGLAGDAGCLM